MSLQLGRLLLKHLIFVLTNHLNQWSLILLNQDLKTSLTEAESSLSLVSRPIPSLDIWPGLAFHSEFLLHCLALLGANLLTETQPKVYSFHSGTRNLKNQPTKQTNRKQNTKKPQTNKKPPIFIISLSAHKWWIIQILALFLLQWQIHWNCYRLVVAGAYWHQWVCRKASVVCQLFMT